MKSSTSVIVRSLAVATFAFFIACAPSGFDPPLTGTGGTGGPINCGGTPGTSPLGEWSAITIFVQDNCAGTDCHATGDREPYLIGKTGPLSDAELYTKLTTFKAPKCGNRVLVKPCEPDESTFLRAQTGMCEGAAGVPLAYMPYGCSVDPPFENCTAQDKLDGIREWIAKGAPH